MTRTAPNIVFFFTDDQRFDTLHALGNRRIHTPTLDWLTKNGTAFTHAHIMGGTCGAVCMPSRAMLMTGRTLFHLEKSGETVPESHALLGETLRHAGYDTFGTGKWHSGRRAYARSFSDGAEIFFGGMGDHWNVPAYRFDPSGRYDSKFPFCPNPWGSNEVKHTAADHISPGRHSTDLFCDAALDFLDRRASDKPFFMYLSFMAPHDPRTMPQKYLDLYPPDSIDLPPNFMGAHPFDNGELHIRDEQLEKWPRTPEAIRRHIAEYYAMISHLDDAIGRIISALRASGRLENTLLVFAGDNGLAVGQHGLMGKQSLYDHSVRVPLVLAGPGIPRGRRSDALVYLSDIFPTLCDLSGIETPESVEGHSLRPILGGKRTAVRNDLYLAYRHLMRGVRDRRHKLIETVVQGRRTTQLFDLQRDPWELCNLADQPRHAPTVRRLHRRLAALRDQLDDSLPGLGAEFWKAG